MAAALLALAAIPAFGQARIGFTLLDELSTDEIAEDTTIYVNGERLGSFHLTPDHRAASIAVEIAAGGSLRIRALRHGDDGDRPGAAGTPRQ